MMVDLLVRVSLVTLVGVAAAAALHRQSAALRHWLLAAALAAAALMPIAALVTPVWHLRFPVANTIAEPPAAVSTATRAVAATASAPRDEVSIETSATPKGPAVTLRQVWTAGAAIALATLFVGFVRLSWLTSRCSPVRDAGWLAMLDDVSRVYGLRQRVVLLQSDHPTLLVTFGVFAPRVILPADASAWSDERMRIVLAHELAHVRRGDWVTQITAELLRCVYWFNPFVWIACRRLRRESEQACDDEVLTLGIDGVEYATHLLDVAAAMRRHRPTWSPALAMARSSSLERRITAMLNVRVTRTPVTRASRVVIAAALAAIAAPLAGLTMFAQALATFSGSVVDPSGAVLPNATLTLANAERRATYAVQTDRDGRFEFVGLPPGEYAFEARVPGFESVRRALTMDGQDVREDIELQVGTLQETIMVVDDGTGSARDSRVNDLSGAAPRPCSVTPAATAGPPVGGRIRPPRKLRDVRPVYPESLRASKAQGEVKLKGIIGVDGLIKTADVVSAPHPDLAAAAVEAVRQWAFDSTLLNCEPIEVTMNVSVTFRPQP